MVTEESKHASEGTGKPMKPFNKLWYSEKPVHNTELKHEHIYFGYGSSNLNKSKSIRDT